MTEAQRRLVGKQQSAGERAAANGHPWFVGEPSNWLWKIGDLEVAPDACAAPYASQIAGRWREAASA